MSKKTDVTEALAQMQSQITQMEIERVPPDLLLPASYNPRTMTSAKRARLKRAIQDFGFVQPVLARREDRLLIGGHQRLEIAKELGIAQVPVVFLDGITDERAMALNVVLNNEEVTGDWDQAKLAEVLQTITMQGLDPTITGFNDAKVEEMMAYTPPASILPEYEAVTKTHHFKVGIYDVPMSAQENDWLLGQVQAYATDRGVLFGFVTNLRKRLEHGKGQTDV